MRRAGLVAAVLTGLAFVAGGAGILLTTDGSTNRPNVLSVPGLTRPLQSSLDGRQPLDLAALEPTPLSLPTPTEAPPPAEEPVAAVAAPVEQPPAAPAVVPREWLDPDFAAQVVALINGERASRGIGALSADAALTQGAQDYAASLTHLGTLSHVAVGDLGSRVLATGYAGIGDLGEALWFGAGAISPDEAVTSWLASPPHAALLVDPTYTVAGVGCYFYEAGDVREGRCVLDVGD